MAFVFSVMASKRKSQLFGIFILWGKTPSSPCVKLADRTFRVVEQQHKTFNTSNLINHLKIKHQEEHADFVKQKGEAEQENQQTISATSAAEQLTLQECEDRPQVWDMNDAQAHHIHRQIGDMIAIDSQPFSIMENVGFTRLVSALEPRYSLPSRRFNMETILPRRKDSVTAEAEVRKAIKPQSAVLHVRAQTFPGSHIVSRSQTPPTAEGSG